MVLTSDSHQQSVGESVPRSTPTRFTRRTRTAKRRARRTARGEGRRRRGTEESRERKKRTHVDVVLRALEKVEEAAGVDQRLRVLLVEDGRVELRQRLVRVLPVDLRRHRHDVRVPRKVEHVLADAVLVQRLGIGRRLVLVLLDQDAVAEVRVLLERL